MEICKIKSYIFKILFLILFFTSEAFADLEKNLEKLEKLFDAGNISKQEYQKAKSILYKMEKLNSQKLEKIKKRTFLKINTYKPSKEKYQKNEIIFGDYRIYTHRPAGVKIKRLSDNKQIAVFSDKLQVKYYNGGEKLFYTEIDKTNNEKLKMTVSFKGVELLKWQGRYVARHGANFFQIATITNDPFHYYISTRNGKAIGLNIKKFDRKIEKAVAKAKVRLASKYNITLSQIEYILKNKERKRNLELQKVLGQEINLEIEKNLAGQIDDTIGQEMAKEFDAIIMEGMEAELSSAIDEAIAEAVTLGISAATAAAAIEAMLAVYAAGGTDADAMKACQAVAGSAC